MEDTLRTKEYLKEMNAVFLHSKYNFGEWMIDSSIMVSIRKIYMKRNGKTCYVDTQKKWMSAKHEWIKFQSINQSRIFYWN